MRNFLSSYPRFSVVLPVAAILLTSALAGCNGKDKDDSASPTPTSIPAAPTTPPGPSNASGSSTPGTNPAGSPGTAPGGPGGTMMNKPSMNPNGVPGDMAITAKVKSALIKDTIAKGINVNTKSGTVVLQGEVANLKDKQTAIAEAKKMEGVKNVIDHLTVKP